MGRQKSIFAVVYKVFRFLNVWQKKPLQKKFFFKTFFSSVISIITQNHTRTSSLTEKCEKKQKSIF